jgi:hypothetical protein
MTVSFATGGLCDTRETDFPGDFQVLPPVSRRWV